MINLRELYLVSPMAHKGHKVRCYLPVDCRPPLSMLLGAGGTNESMNI